MSFICKNYRGVSQVPLSEDDYTKRSMGSPLPYATSEGSKLFKKNEINVLAFGRVVLNISITSTMHDYIGGTLCWKGKIAELGYIIIMVKCRVRQCNIQRLRASLLSWVTYLFTLNKIYQPRSTTRNFYPRTTPHQKVWYTGILISLCTFYPLPTSE